MSLISLESVGKSVELPDGPPLVILDGVNLEVSAGDRVSIVGRSGSGKSTLLNLLGLLDDPTAGRMLFDGRPTSTLGSGERDRLRGREIGFIFQQFNLLQGRTALENVMTPLLYSTGRSFWRRAGIARAMLERVGLGHRIDSMPEKLSGGEQQRVAIARSLVREPRVILADEPTGALDVETGESVMSLLDEVATQSGAALVTITHDRAIAALASTHYLLDHGILVPADASAGIDPDAPLESHVRPRETVSVSSAPSGSSSPSSDASVSVSSSPDASDASVSPVAPVSPPPRPSAATPAPGEDAS